MNDLPDRLENIVSIIQEILLKDFDVGRRKIYIARDLILEALTDIEKAKPSKCQCKCHSRP